MARGHLAAAASIILSVTGVAACGGTSSPTPVTGSSNVGVCGGQTGVASAETAKYIVVLTAEPVPGPASSPSPAPDVVLSGSLTHVSGASVFRIDVHVCDRSTGGVAAELHPSLTLRNAGAGASPVTVPVAVLEGRGLGVNDVHYGNNVIMEPSARYIIGVRIDSANAVDLAYSVPAVGVVITPGPPACLLDHQMCG